MAACGMRPVRFASRRRHDMTRVKAHSDSGRRLRIKAMRRNRQPGPPPLRPSFWRLAFAGNLRNYGVCLEVSA
jgi:hypothetical protein